jgi:hypothetical protein
MLGEVDINVIVPLVECIVGVSSMCQNMEISIKIDSRYIASVGFFNSDFIPFI